MKINFQTGDIAEAGTQNIDKSKLSGSQKDGRLRQAGRASAGLAGAYQVELFSGMGSQGMILGKEKGKSLAALQQEAESVDVGVLQNYMTLMSHTMSEEDYRKLSEEGFHFQEMEPEQAVTILDRIKVEMARSGQVVAGYTDNVDVDTLAAVVGSEAFANSLAADTSAAANSASAAASSSPAANSASADLPPELAGPVTAEFARADLPMTRENVEQIEKSWDMAGKLKTPTEEIYRYMVDNGLAPEIWDFYLAQNSGAQSANAVEAQKAGGYYAEEIAGYYAKSVAGGAAELAGQIDQIIAKANLPITEENRDRAIWLMEKGLPLTAENLKRLNELQQVSFPVTQEAFARAASHAIAEGKHPMHANLAHSRNIYEEAVRIFDYYQSESAWKELGGDITARRQLEEVRLHMSAEVNVKLLKSGFSIDTAPMEQLIEALKQAERQVAEDYFPQDVQAQEKYALYRQANQAAAELPGMPAKALGIYGREDGEVSLARLRDEGRALKEDYRRANEAYEAVRTQPRKDLGDSIRKAFVNVDDILESLNLRPTEENRRAVRILGYNSMEITPQNLEKIQAADRKVQDVIDRMTPARVLKMIRDGINPLEKSMEELQEYFDESEGSYEETAQSYSRFLYGLERKKEITAQEKEAYIGVYRLLRQIEKTDGAVIGALVNTQAQMQFSNLLATVRSGRFQSMDVRIEDAFGGILEIVQKGERIDSQIAAGFVKDVGTILTELSYDVEAQKQYQAQELQKLRETALTDGEAVALLQRGQITANAGNLLAAQALLQPGVNPFGRRIRQSERGDVADAQAGEAVRAQERQTVEGLPDALSDKDTFAEAYQKLIETAKEQTAQESLYQAEDFLDVRSLQMAHRQLSIAGRLAASEEYIIPMYIGEKLAKVRLTVERGGEKSGVHILADLAGGEQIEAQFSVGGTVGKRTLRGLLTGNTQSEVMKLKRTADIFSDYMAQGRENLQGISLEMLTVAGREGSAAQGRRADGGSKAPDRNGNQAIMGMDANDKKTDGADNMEFYRIAKLFLRAVQEEDGM